MQEVTLPAWPFTNDSRIFFIRCMGISRCFTLFLEFFNVRQRKRSHVLEKTKTKYILQVSVLNELEI